MRVSLPFPGLAETIYEVCPDSVSPGDLNQAIMELGATYCQSKGTGLDDSDPLKAYYLTTRIADDVLDFVKGGGDAKTLRSMASSCPCVVCGEKGSGSILTFLNSILCNIDDGLDRKAVASRAHAFLPTDPPRKGKRDEIHNVLVLSNADAKFLMCRRPNDGLLAKQWEFPAVVPKVLLAEEGGGKEKDFSQDTFSDDELYSALLSYVSAVLNGDTGELSGRKKVTKEGGMVHVFSHVRHFMHVHFQTTDLNPSSDMITHSSTFDESLLPAGLLLPSHTEYRWVGVDEMEELGVTSAISKVVKLLPTENKNAKKRPSSSSSSSASHKEATKKAKRGEPPAGKFKMVALDMDGTLLDGEHKLSEASKLKLRELADLGTTVAIATGRSGPAVYDHVNDLALPIDVPAVVYNGGMVLKFKAGERAEIAKPLQRFPVPLPTVLNVLKLAKDNGLLVQYYTHDSIYVNPLNDAHRAFIERYRLLTGASHTVVDDHYESVKESELPLKMLIMTDDPDEVMAVAKEALTDCKLVRGTPPFFVEVLAPGVCKGATLAKLCESIGIPLASTVAFGDGDNDLEFLRDAGYGVAMKNGRDVVKAVSDRITSFSNVEDGVARCLTALQEEGLLPSKTREEK